MLEVFYEVSGEKRFKRNRGACAGSFDSNPCQFTKICETEDKEMQNNIIANNYVKAEKVWRPW